MCKLSAGKAPAHSHSGAELLYLIEGELEVAVGTDVFRLAAGDSIHFDSVQKHAYRSLTSGPCTAVVTTFLHS
jgi:quercetin dioxygenase-like cupin family protein